MIASPLIFCFGVVLNLYVTVYCLQCSKWRAMNNLKYFVVFQTIFNAGNLLAHLILLLRDELNSAEGSAPVQDHTICDILPNITACLMSLSVFNLTAFVVVRYLTTERRWSFSTVKITLTFAGILLSTALLLYPALSYLYHKMPVLKCNGCNCPFPGMSWEANFDVWLYGYMVIMLQFVVPAIIILTAVFRALAKRVAESRSLNDGGGGCRPQCGLKNVNIATLATCLVITFVLPARGIRFVTGESIFPSNVSFVEIDLLNSVFYILEVSWAGVTALLPVCLKQLTDDELLGQIGKKPAQNRSTTSQQKTYCKAFVELELWE